MSKVSQILCFTGFLLVFQVVWAQEICPPPYAYWLHPNCSLFYICNRNGGNHFLESCPGELYWNQEEIQCDWPYNVPICVDGTRPPLFTLPTSPITSPITTPTTSIPSTTTKPTTPPTTNIPSTTTKPTTPPTTNIPSTTRLTTTPPTTTSIPSTTRPTTTPPTTTSIPSTTRLTTTPPTTTRIPSTTRPTTTPPTTTSIPSTTRLTTTPPTTTSNPPTSPPTEEICPPGNFWPHENCTLFYICFANGQWNIIACPGGLFYNHDKQMCDIPANVEVCVGGTRPPYPYTTKSTSTTPTAPTTTINPSITTSRSDMCPSEGTHKVPHEELCEAFWLCVDGKRDPYYFRCPEGLYFDPILEKCNISSEVDCTPI